MFTLNCFKAFTRVRIASACNSSADTLSLSRVGFICSDMLWINLVCCSLCSLVVWMMFFSFLLSTMKRNNRNATKSNPAIRMTTSVQRPTIMYCLPDSLSSFSCMVFRLSSYFNCNAPSSSCALSALTESVQTIYFS